MDTKLTLKLNQEIIERAKEYASDRRVSLSRIVEAYLQSLTTERKTDNDFTISPFIKSMSTGVKIPADLNHKEAYTEFLLDKHK